MEARFFEVLVAHWPVFALLAGLVASMVVIAAWRGRGVERGAVTRYELAGWACVLMLPPVVYVLGLAAALNVEAAMGEEKSSKAGAR